MDRFHAVESSAHKSTKYGYFQVVYEHVIKQFLAKGPEGSRWKQGLHLKLVQEDWYPGKYAGLFRPEYDDGWIHDNEEENYNDDGSGDEGNDDSDEPRKFEEIDGLKKPIIRWMYTLGYRYKLCRWLLQHCSLLWL